jgi:phenylpropionate dioxygenase-like ring-hydroxylating dioxygenase large terminal subunit
MTAINSIDRVRPDGFAGGGFKEDASRSTTLPANWYYEPEIFTRERESIFFRTWSYQCHVSDLTNSGDYYVGEVLDQSILLIRDQAGELRAFYNVCSHRAHPLLIGAGNTRGIVCPYHQWCYETNGRFRAARGFTAIKDGTRSDMDLKPVRLETLGGLVFVNLDPNARSLVAGAGSLLDDLRAFNPRLEQMVRAHRYEVDVAANWKTVIDNNHECYHCDANHKSLLELVAYKATAKWKDGGITFCHTVSRGEQNNGAYAVDNSTMEQDALFGYIWPTTIPLMFPGSCSLALFHVIPLGPEKTRERWDFYFLSKDLRRQERALIDYCSETLAPEDIALCEAVQRGLHSRGYTQGRFVADPEHVEYSEHHVHRFQRFVREAIGLR